jgi:hypothetical protein
MTLTSVVLVSLVMLTTSSCCCGQRAKTFAGSSEDHEDEVRERVAEIVRDFSADIVVTSVVVRARARLLNSGRLPERRDGHGIRRWREMTMADCFPWNAVFLGKNMVCRRTIFYTFPSLGTSICKG